MSKPDTYSRLQTACDNLKTLKLRKDRLDTFAYGVHHKDTIKLSINNNTLIVRTSEMPRLWKMLAQAVRDEQQVMTYEYEHYTLPPDLLAALGPKTSTEAAAVLTDTPEEDEPVSPVTCEDECEDDEHPHIEEHYYA